MRENGIKRVEDLDEQFCFDNKAVRIANKNGPHPIAIEVLCEINVRPDLFKIPDLKSGRLYTWNRTCIGSRDILASL